MSITDELRSWAEGNTLRAGMSLRTARDQALAIADRIDSEHERQLEVLYRDMSDAEWMRLPKDADGVPIHVGDVMEWCDSGETLAVEGIGIDVLFYIDGENAEWTAARNKRHHHADSWERIIKDALTMPFHGKADVAQFVARCKALAGDAE